MLFIKVLQLTKMETINLQPNLTIEVYMYQVPPQQQQQQQHFFVVLMLLLFPVLFSWISSFHASIRRNKISIVYFHGTRKRCWKRGKSPTYEITIPPSQHTWARVFNPFKLWTTFVVSSLSSLIGVVPTLRNLKAFQNKKIFLL